MDGMHGGHPWSTEQLQLLREELSNKEEEAHKSRPSSNMTPPFEPHVRAAIPDGTRSLDLTMGVVETMQSDLK